MTEQTDNEREPMSGAERMRLSRQRQREGKCFLHVELFPGEISALVSQGYLNPADRDDKGAVYDALIALIERALGDGQ